jgi:ATPase subunit of ABC transporter with duplicated ATPase domains
MKELTGGEKVKVLLAQALFGKPEILLLDEPTNDLDIRAIQWLENFIMDQQDTTVLVVSHDRHFLNEVCTHMADMDFGTLKVYPGNYDSYMLASVQARAQQLSSNDKAKEKIAELAAFVARFSANASKARQATSRQKQLEKIEIVEIKPSSRQNPFIRFESEKKLHNMAVECNALSKAYDRPIFKNFKIGIRAGEKIAIIGQNGAGKTTLLKTILSKRFSGISADSGDVKWAENANVGVMPQDNTEMFAKDELLMDWMNEWRNTGDDDQVIRGTLGRLLFSGDDIGKSVKVLSGGEKGRMIWGKLMLQKHNVLAMDEPTNHMDMESIESLQIALEKYEGTLIFVSHDREFVSALANRILEVKMDGTIADYSGTYEEYLRSQALAG